jgi:hypothetical protein
VPLPEGAYSERSLRRCTLLPGQVIAHQFGANGNNVRFVVPGLEKGVTGRLFVAVDFLDYSLILCATEPVKRQLLYGRCLLKSRLSLSRVLG